jgi:hypothetical protein
MKKKNLGLTKFADPGDVDALAGSLPHGGGRSPTVSPKRRGEARKLRMKQFHHIHRRRRETERDRERKRKHLRQLTHLAGATTESARGGESETAHKSAMGGCFSFPNFFVFFFLFFVHRRQVAKLVQLVDETGVGANDPTAAADEAHRLSRIEAVLRHQVGRDDGGATRFADGAVHQHGFAPVDRVRDELDRALYVAVR